MSAVSQTVVQAMSYILKEALGQLPSGQFLIYIKSSKRLVTGTIPVQYTSEFQEGEETYAVDDPSDLKSVADCIKTTEDSVRGLLELGRDIQISIYSSKTNFVSLSISSSTAPKEALETLNSFLKKNLQPVTATVLTAAAPTATAASPSQAPK